MADDVRVKITDATVISALNTPGGAVDVWRNDTEDKVLQRAFTTSPRNDVLNTFGRGHAPPGVYQASWVTRRQGNGHRIGFQIENFADHAINVEFGRLSTRGPVQPGQGVRMTGFPDFHSFGGEVFSWAKGPHPGRVKRARGGTRGWPAKHILRDAVNAVMPGATGGAYTPLV